MAGRSEGGGNEPIELLLREGLAHDSAGRFVEGQARWNRALSLLREQSLPDSHLLVEALTGLAGSYRHTGRFARARETAGEALRLLQPGAIEADKQIWRLERGIGESYALEGQTAQAVKSHRRALDAAARHSEPLRESVVRSHMDLSLVLVSAGDLSAATTSAEEALQLARQHATKDRVTHDAALNLAATYVSVGRAESAHRLLQQEHAILRLWRPGHSKPETAPLSEAMLRPKSRGRVRYDKLSVRLSDGWAYCASKFSAVGTARLTTAVTREGRVSEVVLTGFGISEQAADCMALQAAPAKFPPIEGDTVVVVFATKTFP